MLQVDDISLSHFEMIHMEKKLILLHSLNFRSHVVDSREMEWKESCLGRPEGSVTCCTLFYESDTQMHKIPSIVTLCS